MLTAAQLEERKSGFGGDDAAALFGMHEFKTAFEVVATKLGLLEPEDLDDKDAVVFGNILEDVVAGEFARRNNVKVRKINKTLRSKEHPFMLAHIDRDIVECPEYPDDALEIKTSGNPREWGRSGSDQVPDRVIMQTHHYFAVRPDWKRFHIALLLQGQQWRQYVIPRQDNIVRDVIEHEGDLWENYVKKGKMPDPEWAHRTTASMLQRFYKAGNGKVLPSDSPIAQTLAHWDVVIKEAQAEALAYEKIVEGAKNHVRHLIGENSGIQLGEEAYWVRREVKRAGYVVADKVYEECRFLKNPGKGMAVVQGEPE